MTIDPASHFTTELIGFIAAEVATHDDTITPETDLLMTGLVDSLGVVLIVDWMTDRLGLAIDPTDVILENFQTVAQMVDYAARRGALAKV